VIPSALPEPDLAPPIPAGRAPLRIAVGGEDRLRIRVLFFIAAGCGALMLPLAAFRWSAGAHPRALFNLFIAAVCFALAAGLHRA
jgi:hypothetical protein